MCVIRGICTVVHLIVVVCHYPLFISSWSLVTAADDLREQRLKESINFFSSSLSSHCQTSDTRNELLTADTTSLKEGEGGRD